MPKLKVLVVDDSTMMRKILSKMIDDVVDMEIVGKVSDPFEARDFLMKQIPDVMILDIEMPKMDGLTFLDKLMAHRPFPVLVFSGHAKTGSQVALKALELGAVPQIQRGDYDNSKILTIASSTGGTEALKVFFSGFNSWVPQRLWCNICQKASPKLSLRI